MIALITGASSGIGYELAKEFARHKIDVILIAQNEERLNKLATELREKYSVRVEVYSFDLSQNDAALDVHNKIQEIGLSVDYLVNNAGFGDFGSFINTSWKKEESMIHLNIITLTQLCKLFIPDMVTRGSGKVLNISSTAAFFPGPLMSVYFATKAYVLSFSQAINSSLKNTGVTVTTFCPGPTRTNFENTANIGSSRLFKGKLPLPEQVALSAYRAMMDNKNVVVYGFFNKLLIFLSKFIPRNVLLVIMKKMSE